MHIRHQSIGKCDVVFTFQAFRTSKIKSDTGTRLRIQQNILKLQPISSFVIVSVLLVRLRSFRASEALAYKREPHVLTVSTACAIGVRAVIVGVGDIQKRGE